MACKRKTRDVWRFYVNYGYGWEHEFDEDSLSEIKKRKRHSTRDAVFMGVMRKELFLRLRSELDIPVWETHGYITKYTREEKMHLPKSHINDALAICHDRRFQ